MAVLVAQHWGLLPHIIWQYPLRYYVELRDAFILANEPPKRRASSTGEEIDDFNAESFRGEAI